MLNENLKEGMTVRTSDGEKLGKIVHAEGDTFLIEKGIFFKKDYIANNDEILEIQGDEVWLKGSRDEVMTRGEEGTAAGATPLGYREERTSEARDVRRTEAHETAFTEEKRIPLTEERLEAEKHTREAGEVKVQKRVVEEKRDISVPVLKEEVVVERIPGSEMRAGEPTSAEARFEESTTRIPIHEEEVEIKKRPVVREEVRVGKRTHVEEVRAADSVRREEAEISKEGDIDSVPSREEPKKY